MLQTFQLFWVQTCPIPDLCVVNEGDVRGGIRVPIGLVHGVL